MKKVYEEENQMECPSRHTLEVGEEKGIKKVRAKKFHSEAETQKPARNHAHRAG